MYVDSYSFSASEGTIRNALEITIVSHIGYRIQCNVPLKLYMFIY